MGGGFSHQRTALIPSHESWVDMNLVRRPRGHTKKLGRESGGEREEGGGREGDREEENGEEEKREKENIKVNARRTRTIRRPIIWTSEFTIDTQIET